tara:strand:+ start:1034 stop:1165 length:132 start_codon:yes stop_codon:yes gene_type:complete
MRTIGFTVILGLLLPLWVCILIVKLALLVSDTVLDEIDRRWLP